MENIEKHLKEHQNQKEIGCEFCEQDLSTEEKEFEEKYVKNGR